MMFSDKTTLRLVKGSSNIVRRSSTALRYDPKFTNIKHPDSVMMWGALSEKKGKEGLYLIPKNVTIKASDYVNVLQKHLFNFWAHSLVRFFCA